MKWYLYSLSCTKYIHYYTWSHHYLKLSQDGASVLIQGDPETTELKYPAVTICPKISTKYAIAERLGNYIDPLKLPEELLSLRLNFLTCVLGISEKSSVSNNNLRYRMEKVSPRSWKAVYKVLIKKMF